MTRDESMKAARFLAAVVGKAHARQMDRADQARWRAELAKGCSKMSDAPSWLWSSVQDLLLAHERAYLDHCRDFALEKDSNLVAAD